ncbi:MAG: DNA polymerase subunit beta [Saprospiraceae bacterium]|nr:MAG: DNA polymerase subunit beta [Saprospiraceae bacterium]
MSNLTTRQPFHLNKGKLAFLKPYLPALEAICKKYGVGKLYVFGSLARGDFDEKKSDIDFLVKFKENENDGMELISMLIELENLLHRKVDLVRERPFVNEYFARSVEKTKTLFYEA